MKKVKIVKKEKVDRYVMVVDFTKEEDIQKLRNHVKDKFIHESNNFLIVQWTNVEDVPNGYMGLRPPGIERYSATIEEMLEAAIVIMKFGQIKLLELNLNRFDNKNFNPELFLSVIVTNPLIKKPNLDLCSYDEELVNRIIL